MKEKCIDSRYIEETIKIDNKEEIPSFLGKVGEFVKSHPDTKDIIFMSTGSSEDHKVKSLFLVNKKQSPSSNLIINIDEYNNIKDIITFTNASFKECTHCTNEEYKTDHYRLSFALENAYHHHLYTHHNSEDNTSREIEIVKWDANFEYIYNYCLEQQRGSRDSKETRLRFSYFGNSHHIDQTEFIKSINSIPDENQWSPRNFEDLTAKALYDYITRVKEYFTKPFENNF
jgi:hypothetical protein